jgi:predicted transcriptional regulator
MKEPEEQGNDDSEVELATAELLAAIAVGEDCVAKGRVVSHDEAKKRLSRWLVGE